MAIGTLIEEIDAEIAASKWQGRCSLVILLL
jgi:hypothetical protein